MYVGVNKLIADSKLGQIQELSVQELVNEESTLRSVPPSLCSRRSDSSSSCGNSASALELSKFTVTESTISVDTAELTDISIEELEDDIVSYTNKGNEVSIDSPFNFVDLFDCYVEPSSIVAEEKARNEAAAIKN